MARVGTSLLNLGTWVDGEYPGAGSQTVDSDGLNGNWIKLDRAVGTQHNADGTHKPNVVKGSNLVQSGGDSVVDGATLEFNSNKIRVKANSINGTHLNQTAGQTVDGSTLEFNSNAIRVKDNSITYAKMQQVSASGKLLGRKTSGLGNVEEVPVDNSTVEIDATAGLRVKDSGITAVKLATDAVETAKIKDANVTTAKLEYKEYAATVTQSGASNPTATVLKSTLGGTLTWTRIGVGLYEAKLTNAFANRQVIIFCTIGAIGSPGFVVTEWVDQNTIDFYVYDKTGALADGLFFGSPILIRVYP